MKLNIKKIKSYGALAASVIFALASIITVIYYIIWPSGAYFHSDCTDTILWAQASYDSGSLFNPDFGYAAMLPFGGTMIMLPFIGIFGVSMTTHRIGMVIFALLMLASVWLLCRSLKFSHALSLSAVGLMATILCASEKLREIYYEHVIYYSICVVIICVLLSLFIKFKETFDADNAKKFIFITVCTVLFSVCSALDGMQVIATGVVPVLFAAVGELFLNTENKLFSKTNRTSIYFCLVCGGSVVIGIWILAMLSQGISAGYANAYSSYANMEDWLKNLGNFPQHWFMLFGVDAAYGMSIFSIESIINIIRLGTAVIIAIVPVIALIFYKKFDFGSRLMILAHFGVSAVIMFGYVFGILSAANWRLSPMICTGLIVCLAAFKTAKGYAVPVRLSVLAACVLVLMSGVSFVNIAKMEKNGIETNEKYKLAVQLEEKGLTHGYATFWNSQAITLLSDSKVKAVNVDVNEQGISPAYYQSNNAWFEPQEGVDKYFVLLSDYEVDVLKSTEEWSFFDLMSTDYFILEGGYQVYVFNSTFFLN